MAALLPRLTVMSDIPRYSDAAFNVLQYDMLQEKASSLAHHARLVEQAMAALHGATERDAERPALVRKAAREVWGYFVQREVCGMRDHRDIIRDLRIPGEVLVRLGAMERD